VIGVKVTSPGPEPLPQLFENRRRRRRSHPVLAKLRYDVRLPAASYAAPFVALEAKNSEATVLLAVTALDRGATLLFETGSEHGCKGANGIRSWRLQDLRVPGSPCPLSDRAPTHRVR
jgi:hypothetical protein